MSHVIKAITNTQRCPQYNILRFMCSYGKDLVRSTGPDLLLQNLKCASTTHSVLDMVASHYTIMNSKHSMQALRSLFELKRDEKDGASMNDILKNPNFVKLCKKLKSQAGVIELNETIEALKVMTYVGVPSDSKIIQVLLQLLRHNVNYLTLNHIMFLDFLLGQYKSSPLVEALKIALPMVFEINLSLKLDKSNLSQLTECLYYASRHKLSDQSVELLIKTLCDYPDEFDARSAKSIIWSITDMNADEMFKLPLEKALNDLIVHMDEVSFIDLDKTAGKLIVKYSSKHTFYYNETFFDSCVNNIIDHNLGFEEAMILLRKFIRINHWNKYLIDYICKKVVEDNSLLQSNIGHIYTLVTSLSSVNYKPNEWDAVKDIIKSVKNMATYRKRDILWLRFGASLCLLDIYKLDVLNKCLSEEYLNSLFDKKFLFMSDIENYLCIYHALHLYKKDFIELLPTKYTPEVLIGKMREVTEYPLEGALKKGIGGEDYVLTKMYSKLGHVIDHAILFRKGGYPVAVQQQTKFIEDIEVPPDHYLVCILCIKPIFYTINTKVLRESVNLSIKMLEEQGYPVVYINAETWSNLEEFEKIPYLMQNIKTKVGSDSLSQSVNL